MSRVTPDTPIVTRTPFGKGVRIYNSVYINYNEILSYINRELAKQNKTRDAILSNLQAVLNSMHKL